MTSTISSNCAIGVARSLATPGAADGGNKFDLGSWDEAYFRRCFVVTSADNRPGTTFPSLYSSVASVACSTCSEREARR